MKCRFGELHFLISVSLDYDMNSKVFSHDDLHFSNFINRLFFFFFNHAQPLPDPSETRATCFHMGLYLDSDRSLFEGKVPWQQKVWKRLRNSV